MMRLAPEPIEGPEQDPANQLNVPEPPMAERVMVPLSEAQKSFRLTVAPVGASGGWLTMTVVLRQAEPPQRFSLRAK